MSGGSYDYVYSRIADAAEEIEQRSPDNPLRIAFARHLRLVSKAMHDVEWVDSHDYGPGDDEAAIHAVLNHQPALIGDEAIAAAKRAIGHTHHALALMERSEGQP